MSHTTQPNRPASTGETAATATRAKRPRTVYKGDEIPHRWANAADPFPIRGDNLSTRLAADGTSWLFSYNCPIACRFTRKRKGQKPETFFFLLPSDFDTSSTTHRHLWKASRAIPNGSVFRCPVLVGGGVGSVAWNIGASALVKPDEQAHRVNLSALLNSAGAYGEKAVRSRSEHAATVESVRKKYADAESYRAAFLPRLKRIEMPAEIASAIHARDARVEQLRRIADEKEAAQGRMDWNLIRPEIESLMRQRETSNLTALYAAAKAEIERLNSKADDWSEWLNGGNRPSLIYIPSLWEIRHLKNGQMPHQAEESQKAHPAVFAYLMAAPERSIFGEALGRLLEKGTFKRPVRYAWGQEITQAYPVRTLRRLCEETYPAALEEPASLQKLVSKSYLAPTLLRVGSDGRVETTHGARVPLACVKRAWDRFGPIVARAAAGALSDEDGPELASALPFGIEPYTLTAIDSDGVQIGCHKIAPSEVVRFAASQGWTAGCSV